MCGLFVENLNAMKTISFILGMVVVLFFSHTSFSQGLDWGDAPDQPYPTLLVNNGANHVIVPGIQMGTFIDPEMDGQPLPNAQGDDLTASDDADGVLFTSWILAGQLATLVVTVTTPGMLNAWIDFNKDGDWMDSGEQIFTNMFLLPGKNFLSFIVPGFIVPSLTYARFRFSTSGNLLPTGMAPDGEVEDYQLMMGPPPTGNVYIDPDPTMTFTQNEISLACIPDPNFGPPDLLVAAYNDEPFPGGPGMGVSYSTDGGNTWNNTQLSYPVNPISGVSFVDVFDPSLCIDDPGHVFVSQIATDNNWFVGPVSGLYVHKSIDGGATWQPPVQVSANGPPVMNPDTAYRFNDRDQIVADKYLMSPYHNNIYIAWIKDRGWNMPQPWSDIYFSYSTNGGASFSTALRINAWANNMGNMPVPDVAKNGTVYVAWMNYNVQVGGQGVIFLDKSTNAGVTFGTDIIVDTVNLPPLNLNGGTDARAKGAAVLKVMPSNPNELYIVFAENPPGPDEADIFLIKSTDGGTTWTLPKRVNDDITFNDQFLPWMYIKPNGIIDIAWYDRRNDPADLMWDIYFTTSSDGGNTFAPNTMINGTSFATPTPPKVPDKWMGEYLGLTADYYHAYIAYTSTLTDMHGDVLFDQAPNPEKRLDWGDAPDPTYPTKAINDGARHFADFITYLGSFVDTEPDGIPTVAATGDDLYFVPDDEDGVTFPAAIRIGANDTLKIIASANGFLNAWFDFNADGDWADAGEQVLVDVPLIPGVNNVLFSIPANAQKDTTYCRFRFATYGGLSYTGLALNGEVEDYRIEILDSVPEDLSVDGVTIISGQSKCYNATDSIIVAQNTPVVINNGGDATFIAGIVVLFKPGFQAYSGSTVDAHITTTGNYCTGLPPSILVNPIYSDEIDHEPETFTQGDQKFSIYPNPSTGRLTIDFMKDKQSALIHVMNLQGTRLNTLRIQDQPKAEIDISNLSPGIYLVMIQTNDAVITRKVIKY
jgi:hypothetical protein